MGPVVGPDGPQRSLAERERDKPRVRDDFELERAVEALDLASPGQWERLDRPAVEHELDPAGLHPGGRDHLRAEAEQLPDEVSCAIVLPVFRPVYLTLPS